MSVNFNPSLPVKYVTTSRTKKKDVANNEMPTNKRAEYNPIKNEYRAIKTSDLSPELLTAAGLIIKTNIIMAQRYGMPPKVAEAANTAESLCTKAVKFAERIQNKADRVKMLYKLGEKTTPEGQPVREIITEENGVDKMLEYAPNGDVLRQSTFKSGVLQSITEFRPDGKKNVLTLINGKPYIYQDNLQETAEGKQMDTYITFDEGEISMYFENYEELNDGSSSVPLWIWFKNGQMAAYYENMKDYGNGNSDIELHLRYNEENGELCEYAAGIKNGKTQGDHFMLEEGKWIKKQ